ncbi:MAG TPA: UDP-N-acetylmuramate dehydrogenase [Sedimentisphaerales bacterium]|nr:UDP-N-acetylmuramate dehydrogenase [Sedimentisphaerales bacterium]
MHIFTGLESIVETDYPLAKHTWYRLGGPADFFIRPKTVEQLRDVLKRCNDNKISIFVMGFGSNLVISDDGVRGAVIKLEAEQFTHTEFDGEQLTAWAGADMRKLVHECVKKGLSGLEALTGIPSSVGGAVKMNAGGRFGDIGSVVESVQLMDINGNVFEKSKPELVFDYRQTNITARFILGARLQLNCADPEQVLRTVKEVWIYKENTQPSLDTKSSGCIFKNPRGVSAGALIDRAGLKGLQIGGAVVSEKHANFILAKAGCTSRDILRLIDAIKERVKEQFDIELELEIEIWD